LQGRKAVEVDGNVGRGVGNERVTELRGGVGVN
jgi:hypothetical protein